MALDGAEVRFALQIASTVNLFCFVFLFYCHNLYSLLITMIVSDIDIDPRGINY